MSEIIERASKIKMVVFDVDGVMTDGSLFLGDDGQEYKAFNSLDGHGLKMLQKGGITPAIITGRDSGPLRTRVAALGIKHCHFGTENKRPAAEQTLHTLGLGWHEAAAMGDDWPDLPVMQRVAFACAPANGHAQAKAVAHHITAERGGEGAARAFCDLLLVAGGHYARLLAQVGTHAHAGPSA